MVYVPLTQSVHYSSNNRHIVVIFVHCDVKVLNKKITNILHPFLGQNGIFRKLNETTVCTEQELERTVFRD